MEKLIASPSLHGDKKVSSYHPKFMHSVPWAWSTKHKIQILALGASGSTRKCKWRKVGSGSLAKGMQELQEKGGRNTSALCSPSVWGAGGKSTRTQSWIQPLAPLRMRGFLSPHESLFNPHTQSSNVWGGSLQTLVHRELESLTTACPNLDQQNASCLASCISFSLKPAEWCCYGHEDGAKPCAKPALCALQESQHSLITPCFGLKGHRATFQAPPSIHQGAHKSHMWHNTTSLQACLQLMCKTKPQLHPTTAL